MWPVKRGVALVGSPAACRNNIVVIARLQLGHQVVKREAEPSSTCHSQVGQRGHIKIFHSPALRHGHQVPSTSERPQTRFTFMKARAAPWSAFMSTNRTFPSPVFESEAAKTARQRSRPLPLCCHPVTATILGFFCCNSRDLEIADDPLPADPRHRTATDGRDPRAPKRFPRPASPLHPDCVGGSQTARARTATGRCPAQVVSGMFRTPGSANACQYLTSV